MTAGQAVFSSAADAAALDVLAERLAVQEAGRGAAHAAQLRTLLQLDAVYSGSGLEIGTVPHAALALGCSEHRAGQLLEQALGLGGLPGGLEALECGLLTVEQTATVVELLAPLALPARLTVWTRLQERLLAEADRGSVLPPARLSELLRRWIIAADPTDAERRRKQAEADRRLDYRRRADGLADLFAYGLTGPDAQAILSRIRDRAAAVGSHDERTADQRRLDAFRDLLLGRDQLPLDGPQLCSGRGGGAAPCGCWPGSPVPCGAQVLVHLTHPSALDRGDEPAELVGHGPLEPDLLTDLLLAAPRLRAVWTDANGIPLAVDDRVIVPDRNDPASVRDALLRLAALRPLDLLHPTHPHDHPPPGDGPSAMRPAVDAPIQHSPPGTADRFPAPARLQRPLGDVAVPGDTAVLTAAALGAHAGGSGSYRVPRRLRRLIEVRASRCEWPGCGARAVRCDAEHDLAWPAGPTCACNLGPCCRRHHRVKQLGWTKQRRHGAAVTWTSPGGTGRWLSPPQHDAPARPMRPLPPVAAEDAWAEFAQEQAPWLLADDPAALELRATEDTGGRPDRDLLRDHLLTGDTHWTIDLDDPYSWFDETPALD